MMTRRRDQRITTPCDTVDRPHPRPLSRLRERGAVVRRRRSRSAWQRGLLGVVEACRRLPVLLSTGFLAGVTIFGSSRSAMSAPASCNAVLPAICSVRSTATVVCRSMATILPVAWSTAFSSRRALTEIRLPCRVANSLKASPCKQDVGVLLAALLGIDDLEAGLRAEQRDLGLRRRIDRRPGRRDARGCSISTAGSLARPSVFFRAAMRSSRETGLATRSPARSATLLLISLLKSSTSVPRSSRTFPLTDCADHAAGFRADDLGHEVHRVVHLEHGAGNQQLRPGELARPWSPAAD